MELTASSARMITEEAKNPVDPWDKLFCKIKKQAELGFSMAVFDEEKEGVKFKEHRKEVKSKLEKLGYRVSYSRIKDSDDWYGDVYHNCYTIVWLKH